MALPDPLTSVPVDEAIAYRADSLIYRHPRRGVQFSCPGALVVGAALEHGLTLATTSVGRFPVPGSLE